jgi:SpoVK/Ycf46/Vps4 family AAA+-type ATPase
MMISSDNKPGKLGNIHKPSKELFRFGRIRVAYCDASKRNCDFDGIPELNVRSSDGKGVALTLTFIRKEAHRPRNVKLTFKIAGSDRIIRHVSEKTVCLTDAEEDRAQVFLKTGIMRGGDWFVGIYHRNYLLAIESFYILDPFHPKALKPVDKTPGADDLKQFLKKQINCAAIRAGKTKPVNWNMTLCGPRGTGKERMVRLIFDLLTELGRCTGSLKTVAGRDLLTPAPAGTVMEDAVRAAGNGLLYIRHAEDVPAGKQPDGNPEALSDVLRKLAVNVEKEHVVLILSSENPNLEEMLNASPEMGQLVPNHFRFDAPNTDMLMQIAGTMLDERNLKLSDAAGNILRTLISSTRNRYGQHFRNVDWLIDIFEQDILPRLATRVIREHLLDDRLRSGLILPEDIPRPKPDIAGTAIAKLDRTTGAGKMKEGLTRRLFLLKFNCSRQGWCGKSGSPHMLFAGNPGAGKVTVAALVGEIYRSMGILSSGHVVQTAKNRLVGKAPGETEANMRDAIHRAKGGVLFMDDAYALFAAAEDAEDSGKPVLETLLPVLDDDEAGLTVILSGYPEEMVRLPDFAPGLRSHFPHMFHFSDYTHEDWMRIADSVAREQGLTFSPEALGSLEKHVSPDLCGHDACRLPGNARYAVRLLQTRIIPRMNIRLAKYEGELTADMFNIILPEDIPVLSPEEKRASDLAFDEQAIDEALQRLDKMIGLQRVKTGIHDFVETSRELNRQGIALTDRVPLKWGFIGAAGTGKSIVAGLFARILCAMHILEKGHLVELKAEEIFGVTPYVAEEHLRQAMYRSQQGLLFIDGDASKSRQQNSGWDREQLRMTLAGYAAEMHGSYALVIAECESPCCHHMVKDTAGYGVTEFDRTFIFDNYTTDELLQILTQMLQFENLCMDGEATAIMRSYIEGLTRNSQSDYANARAMKQLAITISRRVRARIFDADAATATAEDVKDFIRKDLPAGYQKTGYLPD